MAKQEYEGVAWMNMMTPDGGVISVTERAESSVTAYANLMETRVVMLDDGLVPFNSYYNKAQENIAAVPMIIDTPQPTPPQLDPIIPAHPDPFPEPASLVAQAKSLGGVEADPFAGSDPFYDAVDTPYVDVPQLVDRLKKAGEWKTGEVQEILVDQYTLGDGAIKFYKSDNENDYHEHAHYLNDYGVKDMATFFGNTWNKAFAPAAVPTLIPGGAFIIAVKGGKVRTSGQGAGNCFRNLAGARRQ